MYGLMAMSVARGPARAQRMCPPDGRHAKCQEARTIERVRGLFIPRAFAATVHAAGICLLYPALANGALRRSRIDPCGPSPPTTRMFRVGAVRSARIRATFAPPPDRSREVFRADWLKVRASRSRSVRCTGADRRRRQRSFEFCDPLQGRASQCLCIPSNGALPLALQPRHAAIECSDELEQFAPDGVV